MASNIFRRLSELVPDAPVLIGRVIEHHDDDTSSVLLPSALGTTGIGMNVASGSIIRPRRRTVPVGKNAFVRRGVIESEAPDGDPVQVVIGRVVAPPPAPVVGIPLDTRDYFVTDGAMTDGLQAEHTLNDGRWGPEHGSTMFSRADGAMVVAPWMEWSYEWQVDP